MQVRNLLEDKFCFRLLAFQETNSEKIIYLQVNSEIISTKHQTNKKNINQARTEQKQYHVRGIKLRQIN